MYVYDITNTYTYVYSIRVGFNKHWYIFLCLNGSITKMLIYLAFFLYAYVWHIWIDQQIDMVVNIVTTFFLSDSLILDIDLQPYKTCAMELIIVNEYIQSPSRKCESSRSTNFPFYCPCATLSLLMWEVQLSRQPMNPINPTNPMNPTNECIARSWWSPDLFWCHCRHERRYSSRSDNVVVWAIRIFTKNAHHAGCVWFPSSWN